MGAVVADNNRALSVVAYLAETVPYAAPLDIRVATGDEREASVDVGDVQLRLDLSQQDISSEPTTVDLLLGGPDGSRLVATALPWNEAPQRLARLVKIYQVERCGKDTFRTWAASRSVDELRERLGLAAGLGSGR